MSTYTVCVQYRDRSEPVEHEVIPVSKMVQLVRGFNDTFVESFEVFDSEGEELSDDEVWLIVDSLGTWLVIDAHD